MAKIRVCGPKTKVPNDAFVINTTSRGKNPDFLGLSPFFLGPVPIWDPKFGIFAKNMENAWQFSKVYKKHVGENGFPTPEWLFWALRGFQDDYAHRYPMGKGAKPEFSFWNGEKLDYVAARKKIYCPLYAEAVKKTNSFEKLAKIVKNPENDQKTVWLWDFDGYDYTKMDISLKKVINDPYRSMGHAFVLAMLLQGEPWWLER